MLRVIGSVTGFALLMTARGGGGAGGLPDVPPATGCVSTATVVCTQYGQLQGAVEGDYRAFRGIPFAAPPGGDLRWRPPAQPESWQGMRDTTGFGNVCPQVDFSGMPLGNEDCLTLNVYAVNPPASAKQSLPFIFGNLQTLTTDMPWLPCDSGENILQLHDNMVNLAGGYRNAQCDFLSTLPTRF